MKHEFRQAIRRDQETFQMRYNRLTVELGF